MSPLPPKSPTALPTAAGSSTGGDPGADPTASPIGLGWRVCMLVWVFGFVGLFAYEVGSLLWRVGKGMFGNAP